MVDMYNGYYSAFEKKEMLSHATTWMNLMDMMTSEINLSQKDKYCMILLTWGIQTLRNRKKKSRMVVATGWEDEEQGMGVVVK